MTNTEANKDVRPLVYVRAVDVSELPEDVRDQTEGLEQVWALHSETGDRLALAANKRLAFDLALHNRMQPVTVH